MCRLNSNWQPFLTYSVHVRVHTDGRDPRRCMERLELPSINGKDFSTTHFEDISIDVKSFLWIKSRLRRFLNDYIHQRVLSVLNRFKGQTQTTGTEFLEKLLDLIEESGGDAIWNVGQPFKQPIRFEDSCRHMPRHIDLCKLHLCSFSDAQIRPASRGTRLGAFVRTTWPTSLLGSFNPSQLMTICLKLSNSRG